ncbi:transmembrane protein, putative (macronuclear) [Tetrahymena thermophila SB210]|uniref:Transmembrane protein, putative n=1 Tax=Tetrahymena thermophila (strain SB210) TaxID=312017 RepID=I7MJJ3_TETTS|nr:transmembrane protein, putative [Tetrahymena thermophila SB210]EAS06312.2 transmembrane protein, putative [Tetrahymena thermophila SB210]|eukprot:XP_001026557.2 transmembrane protein, putative [Tetrahymena thermophila SB210]
MKIDDCAQKENTKMKNYTKDTSDTKKNKISKRIILSLLQITKRILELYLTQQLIIENQLAFDSILWIILILIQFSYNIIMVAAIICNYKTYFQSYTRLTKNSIIVLSLLDLESLYQIIYYQKTQQEQCRFLVLIQQKMNFINNISVLYMCLFVYLFGLNQRIIYLKDIILLLVYFFILYIQFKTLGEQIRILQIFYIGAMIEVDFFFNKNNLTNSLIFIEFIVVLILILVCILIMLKQQNYLHAFASRYMIKESLRILFFKPAVIVKDFKYLQSPSLPELINLYIYKIKFKHLGYTWRIIENVIISTYLIFQMNQLKGKPQVIIIPSQISVGEFHLMLNLVICALSYAYTFSLLFKTFKIVKFIPSLSNEVILELEDLKTSQIRSDKFQNYYWTPSSDLDTNILDLRKQTFKSEKISSKVPKMSELLQEKPIQSEQQIKHAQFIKQQQKLQPFKNITKNPKNKKVTDDNQLSCSQSLIKESNKHLVKFYSHNGSFNQQMKMIQDENCENNNNKMKIELSQQINEQKNKSINIPLQNNKYFKNIKQQNIFLKQQKNKINNTQIASKTNIQRQNILQEEQIKNIQQSNNYIDSSQIKLQNQESTNKTEPSNILFFKNQSNTASNQTKNHIILLTNYNDDSVLDIIQKN